MQVLADVAEVIYYIGVLQGKVLSYCYGMLR